MQQPIDNNERDVIFEKLRQNPDNNKCIDCEKKNPKWASVYLGLFICIDCAGKHREYGVQISFVRSLTLDSWNRRQITFMELGGNTKALEHFRKYGIKPPIDYKNANVQKYKQDLTKKVDAELAGGFQPLPTATTEKPANPAPKEETPVVNNNSTTVPKIEANPNSFFENITMKPAATNTGKGFTVEFAKEKPTFGANKGALQAKKIANFDISNLTLEESDGKPEKKVPSFSMSGESPVTSPGMSGNSNANKPAQVKEITHKTGTSGGGYQDREAENNLKKFANAKAISSDAFYGNDKKEEFVDAKRFSGATAISSAQVFGYEEEEPSSQTGENLKDMFWKIGGKLKEKTGNVLTKLKNDWESS